MTRGNIGMIPRMVVVHTRERLDNVLVTSLHKECDGTNFPEPCWRKRITLQRHVQCLQSFFSSTYAGQPPGARVRNLDVGRIQGHRTVEVRARQIPFSKMRQDEA